VINPAEVEKQKAGDEAYYSNGTRTVTFDIKGVKFGVLICADFRKPQLYLHYKSLGVQVMLHAYHNGGQTLGQARRRKNVRGEIVPATMQFCASNSDMWISASNTSRRQSCWPAFLVTPDGCVDGKLPLHKTGALISEVDTRKPYYRVPHYDYTPIKTLYRNPRVKEAKRSVCRTEF
jgi:predicted amidohydrolase